VKSVVDRMIEGIRDTLVATLHLRETSAHFLNKLSGSG